MAPGTRASKRGYHHGDLRRALVKAAVALLREKDVASLSLREVARRAGVTGGAPYHHFRDKNALLAAVALEGYRALHAEVARALIRAGEHALDRLRALGETYVRFGVGHPSHYRVMFLPDLADPENDPELYAAAGVSFEQLVHLLEQASPTRLSADQVHELALVAWSSLHGLVSMWNEGPLRNKVAGGSIEPLARRTVGYLVGLISAEGARDDSTSDSEATR